jgi:hypothetical protein
MLIMYLVTPDTASKETPDAAPAPGARGETLRRLREVQFDRMLVQIVKLRMLGALIAGWIGHITARRTGGIEVTAHV